MDKEISRIVKSYIEAVRIQQPGLILHIYLVRMQKTNNEQKVTLILH